jgi:hypothetical protein
MRAMGWIITDKTPWENRMVNGEMMDQIKKLVFLIILLSSCSGMPVMAEDLKIVTPYWGTEENTYQSNQYGLNLKDSQTMKGLYLQSIDTGRYQWNLFIYRTENINYADLTGVNFICDIYYGKDNNAKNAIGMGINYLHLDLAGKNVPTSMGILNGFNLAQDTSSFYVRFGKYYKQALANLDWTLMPWFGGQTDHSEGDGWVDPSGHGTIPFKINENQYYWIAGLNFKADYHHFLQVEAKHTITFNHNDYFQKNTAMMNLFLNSHWGLSYRYNDQETASGNDKYHIFGLAVLF